jgi:hypothetical protein
MDMEKCILMATPLWNALVLVGFHIDFALVLLAVATGTEEENNLIKKKVMEYYFSKTINDSFENAIEKVTAALKVEGFEY